MQVNLKKISGKKKNLWWMNAADGKLTYLGECGESSYEYQPKKIDGQKVSDGVLIAVDVNKDYLKKEESIVPDLALGDKKRNLNE
jgi:hypothetical protein